MTIPPGRTPNHYDVTRAEQVRGYTLDDLPPNADRYLEPHDQPVGYERRVYVVWRGRTVGLFWQWKNCERSVHCYPRCHFRRYANITNARIAYYLLADDEPDDDDAHTTTPGGPPPGPPGPPANRPPANRPPSASPNPPYSGSSSVAAAPRVMSPTSAAAREASDRLYRSANDATSRARRTSDDAPYLLHRGRNHPLSHEHVSVREQSPESDGDYMGSDESLDIVERMSNIRISIASPGDPSTSSLSSISETTPVQGRIVLPPSGNAETGSSSGGRSRTETGSSGGGRSRAEASSSSGGRPRAETGSSGGGRPHVEAGSSSGNRSRAEAGHSSGSGSPAEPGNVWYFEGDAQQNESSNWYHGKFFIVTVGLSPGVYTDFTTCRIASGLLPGSIIAPADTEEEANATFVSEYMRGRVRRLT